MEVRKADMSDIDRLAAIWYEGWHDAHSQILPIELFKSRTFDSFKQSLHSNLDKVHVIGELGRPVGMCMLKDGEVNQFYVSAEARGKGVAAALIAKAEMVLAGRDVKTAWLACAIGNHRAAKFYEKNGWRFAGNMFIELEIESKPQLFEVWRYEKTL